MHFHFLRPRLPENIHPALTEFLFSFTPKRCQLHCCQLFLYPPYPVHKYSHLLPVLQTEEISTDLPGAGNHVGMTHQDQRCLFCLICQLPCQQISASLCTFLIHIRNPVLLQNTFQIQEKLFFFPGGFVVLILTRSFNKATGSIIFSFLSFPVSNNCPFILQGSRTVSPKPLTC